MVEHIVASHTTHEDVGKVAPGTSESRPWS